MTTFRSTLPMSPRATRNAWRTVAALVVLVAAAACWSNIRSTLDRPIDTVLGYSGNAHFERVTGGSAHATTTGVDSVGVELTHISSQLQWLLALSTVNGALISTAVTLVFGLVWIWLGQRQPFAPSVTRSLVALAIVVAVFGTIQQVLDSWVRSREIFEAVGSSDRFSPYSDPSGFQLNLTAVFIGFGIAVLATAFAIGARLTRDSEGLV